MRLGQPERLGDLGLRPFQEEPLEDDLALAWIERAGRAGDQGSVEAQLLEWNRAVVERVVVQLERPACRVGDDTSRGRELGSRGLALERSRDSHGRAAVTEVPAQLTLDTPHHVGRKLGRPRWITSLDRPDDGERCNLSQVVLTLAGSSESARHADGERQVELEQPRPLGVGCRRIDEHSSMLRLPWENF